MENQEYKVCAIIEDIKLDPKPYIDNENTPECREVKRKLAEKIDGLYQNGVKNFMSDCERGFSMWAAEAVIVLKHKYWDIRLHAIAPNKNQTAKWTENMQLRCKIIHSKADSVTVLHNTYASEKYMRDAYAAYAMINNSDCIIAEGDANLVIDYAEKKGLTVTCI